MEQKQRRFVGALAFILFVGRRFLMAASPSLASRRFVFAIAAVALLAAKVVHIYAHIDALPNRDVLLWGLSFFTQDTALLLVLYPLLCGNMRFFATAPVARAASKMVGPVIILFTLPLALISISFFVMTGSELQWRNVALAGDEGSWKMMATGLAPAAVVLLGLLATATVLKTACYALADVALDVLQWPAIILSNNVNRMRRARLLQGDSNLGRTKVDIGENSAHKTMEEHSIGDCLDPQPHQSRWGVQHITVGILLASQAICTIVRPADSSLVYMSWTLPLMPIVDLTYSSPTLGGLLALSSSVSGGLDNCTALTSPVEFPWLPKNVPTLAGFEDWYEEGNVHYSASADPLGLSNLDDDLLPALRRVELAKVPIRHVMLIKLESTRKDVFPIKREGMVIGRFESTFRNKAFPEEAREMLASLTPTARFLTGDHDDGFENYSALHDARGRPRDVSSRGGLSANNAFTASTYTFKSLVGTLCGCSALVADFNVEHEHHIYQPCLAHIFDAFNLLNHTSDSNSLENDFTSFQWKSSFMQSVTDRYDKQEHLMPAMGYPKKDQRNIDYWYLKGSPKFGPVDLYDVNYYGMPEVAIKDYIRDAFAVAKEKNQRVFLTHITSTTHHAFGIPEEEQYFQLTDDANWDDLSKYVNAVGYVDRWLRDILDTLALEGVADETLLVFAGDHGLSIAERGTLTPYSNPHIANYHVPLVISHPKLPPINIDDAVTSLQILPTILDLLVETGSLSKSATKAARDLARNYEGQSLLRPLRNFSEKTGQGGWQFTVMNPGGSTVAVRDARHPSWRLIVPVFGNYEWRFTDITVDPHEEQPILSFDLDKLKDILETNQEPDAVRWVEEAAIVTRWWVGENHKRWRYEL